MHDKKVDAPSAARPTGTRAELPVVDPVAFERLRKLGGNELILRMIGLFLGHVGPRVEEARACDDSGDMAGVEHAAHSVKSSAGNLGASQLFELAGRLEQLAHDRDAPRARVVLEEFEAAFARARRRLEQYRAELEP